MWLCGCIQGHGSCPLVIGENVRVHGKVGVGHVMIASPASEFAASNDA
jgi:hypothetical protein